MNRCRDCGRPITPFDDQRCTSCTEVRRQEAGYKPRPSEGLERLRATVKRTGARP